MVASQPPFHIRGKGLEHQASAHYVLCAPSRTAAEIACCGVGLEVIACGQIQASVLRVAHAVAVHILHASAATHTNRIQYVALAIASSLGQSRPIANATKVELQAGTVVVAGELVVVARRRISASEHGSKFSVVKHAFSIERHRTNLVRAQSKRSLGQDLEIQRASHSPSGGDLHDQDPHDSSGRWTSFSTNHRANHRHAIRRLHPDVKNA